MPEIIDKELKALEEQGKTAKAIHVGSDLYQIMVDERFDPRYRNVYRNDQVAGGELTVSEYKGIKVVKAVYVAPDYLKIETD